MTTDTCVFHESHDPVTDLPTGTSCGAPATHAILWMDGTGRYSTACTEHLEVDDDAPPHFVIPLDELRNKENAP